MRNTRIFSSIAIFTVFIFTGNPILADEMTSYDTLLHYFKNPDHATYGEVPLWWWEGAPMSNERVTWQLETLADQGVKAVCPIQRSPGRCDPQSFDDEWWEMFRFVNQECQRLGIQLWAYDQIGYGHYGWLEKAAARTRDESIYKIDFQTVEANSGDTLKHGLPEGRLIAARAYPLENGIANDQKSIDIREAVDDKQLEWTAPQGQWRITLITAKPQYAFYLSEAASDMFLDMLYGKIERTLGKESMGTSFAGVFQDEHPPTPTDNYTDKLASHFLERFGYPIGRAIPALHFDVGPLTPKYRTDFYDAYLGLIEKTYWKKVFDWTEERNILTSHDNWGRNNIYTQSRGYIDYFRSQRWFSSPGYDDAGQRPVTQRNYYDAKIASSIARLYDRSRVWNEAFHSSGWGRTTDQTLSWLSAGMAFGANLYDEHGLYYSTNASTWEHAAPDPHWRQPYWEYYGTLSDWVTRTSYLMSQGQHVVDAAVHYPVASLLADLNPNQTDIDYNLYMRLSQTLFDAEIDNDIADDDSILNGKIENGKLWMGKNGYQALVFGPEQTIRRSVLQKAYQFVNAGGTVLFYQQLPSASTEEGRNDSEIQTLLTTMLGVSLEILDKAEEPIRHRMPNGGLVAYVPANQSHLPQLISSNIDRDFQSKDGKVYVTHRRIEEIDIYLVQNISDGNNELDARFRVDAVPEIWDPFTGKVQPVDRFERRDGYTYVIHRLEGSTAYFFIFKPGDKQSEINQKYLLQPEGKPLLEEWEFSVIPTRDNRWGEFRWPPSDDKIGPEVRYFRYKEEQRPEESETWNQPGIDDSEWPQKTYSMGPYWLMLDSLPGEGNVAKTILPTLDTIQAHTKIELVGKTYEWQTVEFSKQIGLTKAVPWGGHSGYPDGHIDKNFIQLPEGRKVLFTHLISPREQRLGLRVELRNSKPRLWVNGIEQPFEDAVGNLPLNEGENTVLLDLPDGQGGRLFVQEQPPSVKTLDEAAKGEVTPDLRDAHWIWVDDAHACYMRKSFTLDETPQAARLIVTAFSGYRLFVNGVKLEEEIGPWARWTHPESFNIKPYLQEGKNVIALWGQLYFGQHVNRDAFSRRGAILAMKVRNADGNEWSLVTNESWKGVEEEQTDWENMGFDDSPWPNVDQRAKMGAQPWGSQLLNNIGTASEPKRPLSVNLSSPYLECFNEIPGIIYDVKPAEADRIGWYRFSAPPGLYKMYLHTDAKAQVWVDGKEVNVNGGIVTVNEPPEGVSTVAIRMEMPHGEYAGAAFPKPISLELKGGNIKTGDWRNFALPTYSGIGVYKQTVQFNQEELKAKTVLDLGEVRVAAEVFVNEQPAGVRLAKPFKYDISPFLKKGANSIEIRVANTIAPHYTTIPALHIGPMESGLVGPVTLRQELAETQWINWAEKESDELQSIINTSTPELREQQKEWEKTAPWLEIPTDPRMERNNQNEQTYTYNIDNDMGTITGIRLALKSTNDQTYQSANIKDLEIIHKSQKRTPIQGRFIRVEIPNRSEYLSLAEVQVFQGNENIALDGFARQSGTSADGAAHLAIDNNTDGRYFVSHSVTHTPNHPNPWWELDLRGTKEIDRIVLWNRTDRAQQEILRLHDFSVKILDEEHRIVWQTMVKEPPDPNISFVFSGPRTLRLSDLNQWQGQDKHNVDINRNDSSIDITFPLKEGKPNYLIAEVNGNVQLKPGELVIKLTSVECSISEVSITKTKSPFVNIPNRLNNMLLADKDTYTENQKARLERFYRSIAPSLEPVRVRSNTLKEQLEQMRR